MQAVLAVWAKKSESTESVKALRNYFTALLMKASGQSSPPVDSQ